jgi:hypothetical protein
LSFRFVIPQESFVIWKVSYGMTRRKFKRFLRNDNAKTLLTLLDEATHGVFYIGHIYFDAADALF